MCAFLLNFFLNLYEIIKQAVPNDKTVELSLRNWDKYNMGHRSEQIYLTRCIPRELIVWKSCVVSELF